MWSHPWGGELRFSDAPPTTIPTAQVAKLTEGLFHSSNELEEAKHEVHKLRMCSMSNLLGRDDDVDAPTLEPDSDDESGYWPSVIEMAQRLVAVNKQCNFVRGAIEAREPSQGSEVERAVDEIRERFAKTSLSGVCPVNPPIRGPFGEAEIWLKPDAVPVNVAPYRLAGERKAAWTELVDKVLEAKKNGTRGERMEHPFLSSTEKTTRAIPARSGFSPPKCGNYQGWPSVASHWRHTPATRSV